MHSAALIVGGKSSTFVEIKVKRTELLSLIAKLDTFNSLKKKGTVGNNYILPLNQGQQEFYSFLFVLAYCVTFRNSVNK